MIIAAGRTEWGRRGHVGDYDFDGDGSAESCDHGMVGTRVQSVEDFDIHHGPVVGHGGGWKPMSS